MQAMSLLNFGPWSLHGKIILASERDESGITSINSNPIPIAQSPYRDFRKNFLLMKFTLHKLKYLLKLQHELLSNIPTKFKN